MEVFSLSEPRNRFGLMADDVKLLYDAERYTSCVLLVLCFVDALASPRKDSSRGAFAGFIDSEFRQLAEDLAKHVPKKRPGKVLYDAFRNGLTHGLGLKSGFALCRDQELGGAYVGIVSIPGAGEFAALNVDRLVNGFLSIVRRKLSEAA